MPISSLSNHIWYSLGVGDDAPRLLHLGIHGDIVRFGHLLSECFFKDVRR